MPTTGSRGTLVASALTLACTSHPLEGDSDPAQVYAGSCPTYVVASASITDFEGGVFADTHFFTFDDQTGSTTPAPPTATPSPLSPARDGSLMGLHLSGRDHAQFGGGFGVLFLPCADASAFSALSFWAKGDVRLRVTFGTYQTRPIDIDGGCETVQCRDSEVAIQPIRTG